jgi:hypothetical protein
MKPIRTLLASGSSVEGKGITRPMRGRLRIAAVMMVYAAAIVALPAMAHAATWTSQYPVGTIHTQPPIVSVDLFGAAKLNAKTAVISIDNVPNKTFVSQGAASGHWSYGEVLQPDGVTYRAIWTWVADTGGATKATLSCYPGTFGDGSHRVTATVKDVTGATLTATPWQFDVEVPPTIGAVTPLAGSTVNTSTPTITLRVSDNTYLDYVTIWVNGVVFGDASVSGGVGTLQVGPLSDGSNTIFAQVFDGNGNEGDKTWTFTVATTTGQTCTDALCHSTVFNTDPAMGPNCVHCHVAGTPIAPHPDQIAQWSSPANLHNASAADILTDSNQNTAELLTDSCLKCHSSLQYPLGVASMVAPIDQIGQPAGTWTLLPGSSAWQATTCHVCHDPNATNPSHLAKYGAVLDGPWSAGYTNVLALPAPYQYVYGASAYTQTDYAGSGVKVDATKLCGSCHDPDDQGGDPNAVKGANDYGPQSGDSRSFVTASHAGFGCADCHKTHDFTPIADPRTDAACNGAGCHGSGGPATLGGADDPGVVHTNHIPPLPSASITGIVVSGVGRAPIAGANVFLYKKNADGTWPPASPGLGSPTRSLTTAADGTYASGPLPLGDYRVRFFSLHTGSQWWQYATSFDLATTISLTHDGQALGGIEGWFGKP